MYERILVALDGSKLAEAVLPYVESIASAFDSQVMLAHVCPPEEGPFTHMHEIYMEQMRQEVARKLEGKKAKVELVILMGKPPEELLSYAEKQGSGLIAFSTHGRSGISRWRLGSISNKIIRAAKTPMLVIHSKTGQVPKPSNKSILVPLDGSTAGEAALSHAEALAQATNREVVLLRVLEPVVFTGDIPGESATYSERQMQAEWRAAENYLGGIVRQLQEKKVAARFQIKMGSPAQEIAQAVKKLGIGLIAMSTYGRSGIARWVLGSVTEKILETVEVPVLVVRAQAASA